MQQCKFKSHGGEILPLSLSAIGHIFGRYVTVDNDETFCAQEDEECEKREEEAREHMKRNHKKNMEVRRGG